MTTRTPSHIIQPGELRRLRKAAGLTQAQLGTLAGYTQQTIGEHEAGRRPIHLNASNAYRYVLET